MGIKQDTAAGHEQITRTERADEPDFVVSLGPVESLTFGGGKTFEDNGAIYQRG